MFVALLPPANEVCEGYVFTGVCLSKRGGVSIPLHAGTHPLGADTPRSKQPSEQIPPSAVHAGRYGQQAGSKHPTGRHACCLWEQTANCSEKYLLGSFYFDSTEKYFSCHRKDGHRRPAFFNQ